MNIFNRTMSQMLHPPPQKKNKTKKKKNLTELKDSSHNDKIQNLLDVKV